MCDGVMTTIIIYTAQILMKELFKMEINKLINDELSMNYCM